MAGVSAFLSLGLFLSSLRRTFGAEISLWSIQLDDLVSVTIRYTQEERRDRFIAGHFVMTAG